MLWLKIIFIFLLIQQLHEIQGKKISYSLRIHNVTCEVCNNWVIRYHCDLQNVTNNAYAFNFLIALNRQLPSNTDANILADVRPAGGRKVVKFLNIKMNVCNALGNMKTNPLVMIFQEKMIQHSNLPAECPIKANTLYNISDVIVSQDLIPGYAPSMDFNVTIAFYQEITYLGKVFVQGSTERLN
ncbi:uncharacterized protein [Musca autumnalis]|uniref:uncharacterized protein n=1 Tax=Musca autumnalis TaxID=221902 RepID=UPI003CF03602